MTDPQSPLTLETLASVLRLVADAIDCATKSDASKERAAATQPKPKAPKPEPTEQDRLDARKALQKAGIL